MCHYSQYITMSINVLLFIDLIPPPPLSLGHVRTSCSCQAVEHGACPVIDGQKWAANLWVWNGPRYGMSSVDSETGRTVGIRSKGATVENDPTFKVITQLL